MLALSQTTSYAIHALSFLVDEPDRWVLSREIADRTALPHSYLSKILHALRQSRLVDAKRGYRGGFRLARAADDICLLDIVEAVEGRTWLPTCLLGLTACSDAHGCPTHEFWKSERARIEGMLRRTTLTEVAAFESSTPRAGRPAREAAVPVAHGSDDDNLENEKS